MSRPTNTDCPVEKRAAMARALSQGGFSDVLVLRRDTAESVLTDKRREILSYLDEHEVDSVRALARELDRDKGAISRDLGLLAEYDVVEYVETGASKAPRLKHETVVVEPIV